MGKHGKEVENDSRRLLSICMENDFRIMKPVLSTKRSTSHIEMSAKRFTNHH